MEKYEYQILRYTHDLCNGEFVNVGILFYVHGEKYLNFQGLKSQKRVSDFFTGINGNFLLSTIRHIESLVNDFKMELSQMPLNQDKGVKYFSGKIMPPNDGALQFSEIRNGITLIPEKTFESLYKTYIIDYELQPEKESSSDDETWRQVYTNYFKTNGIAAKL